MSLQEIANILVDVNRPFDLFGDVNEEELKRKYHSLAKVCHPDIVDQNDQSLAEKTMKILNNLYNRAIEEIKKGVYNLTDEKEILQSLPVIFEFDIKKKNYKFYRTLNGEDISDIYEGICDDKIILLKVVIDEEDNELINDEYNMLINLNHLSIPKVLTKVKINNREGLIFQKPDGITIEELKKEYGFLDGLHVCWILERLLSAIGYLHNNKIVHGNIKEENVLIDVNNHNVILKDYTLSISNANEVNSKYKIINEDYSPAYVNSTAKVKPNVDIYAVGKIAINLLGGDISRVALPVSCDQRIRTFIRKLLQPDQNDAWKLWDELIKIREEVYGTKKFQTLEKKKVRRI